MELGNIAYKILFNDEKERLPNPNLPENIPRIKAMEAAKTEKFKRFWEGSGAVLFERWQDKIRNNMLELLVTEPDCNCKTCNKVRETFSLLKMLAEAEIILKE